MPLVGDVLGLIDPELVGKLARATAGLLRELPSS